MENVFEKGCLIQLSTSVWGASRKIKPEQITNLVEDHQWLSATKKLIEPGALKPINKVVGSSRAYLNRVSLPFPINGLVFVPKEMITRIDDNLLEYKLSFDQAVNSFLENYDELRSAAMQFLGPLFNEIDYPQNIKQRFDFVWRFVVLDVPNGNTALLAPEVYEREKEKFMQTMEQTRQMGIDSLRSEFASMIERLTERFTDGPDGKPKVFKKATVHHFYEFFESFRERNIFRDDGLEELVNRARSILDGTSAEAIRSDELLKEKINSGMKGVETALSEILTPQRRKIILN